MTHHTATSPIADDAARVPAIGVAGPRAMFASSSHLPMLRGPTIAYAPEDDAGAAEPAGGAEAEEIDEDRAPAPAEADEAPEGEGEDGEDGAGKTDNPDEPDAAEIEHDGTKFKVPAKLKDAFLRQADYTQKTQTLADERRTFEGERTTWQSQQAERVAEIEAFQEDVGKVHSLKSQVAAFAEIDWAKAYEEAGLSENPAAALAQVNAAKARFDGLNVQLTEAEKGLKSKIEAHQQGQREANAKAMQDVGKTLAEQIPGWTPERAGELVKLGQSRGITLEDMQTWTDPRAWLLLHDFHQANAKIASLEVQLQGKTKVQEQEKAQGARPATSVSGRTSPSTGPDNRQSTKVWMERREAQLAAKRQAGGKR